MGGIQAGSQGQCRSAPSRDEGVLGELWRRAGGGVSIFTELSFANRSLMAPWHWRVSLGWRVDEARAALGLHQTCRHTHGPTLCMELAGTQLSTPQLLREHHEKGVGWGPGGGRALC